MPRFRVLELSFVDNRIVHPGTEIEYDGLPAANLIPVDPPARKAVQEAAKSGQPTDTVESPAANTAATVAPAAPAAPAEPAADASSLV